MTYPSWILGIFLVYAAVVLVQLKSAPDPLCKALNTLRNNLTFTERRTFMSYNFPINYTIRVRHEEVLRFNNISKLRSSVPGLLEEDIQELWFVINLEVLKKVLKVLSEKHPSYKYTFGLELLFKKVQQVFLIHSYQERELPDQIQEILDNMKDPNIKVWKAVKPKALMDNCYRTMHCLFPHCFPVENKQPDYCSFQYWKKSNNYPKYPEGSASAIKETE